VRSVPDTVAAEAEDIELIRFGVTNQVATVVGDVVVVLIISRLLNAIPTAEVLAVEVGVAVEVEGNGVTSSGTRIEGVLVPRVVEGLPVDVALQLGVQSVLIRVGGPVGDELVEEVNGVTNLREGVEIGIGLVAESVERIDSDEGIHVLTSNLATVLPIIEVAVEVVVSGGTLSNGTGLQRTVGVVLGSASSSVASPADIADVINTISGVGASEANLTGIVVQSRIKDARSGERRDDTRKLGAIVEVIVVAVTSLAVGATAVSGIDKCVATITEIVVNGVAVAVPRVAVGVVVVIIVVIRISAAVQVETSVGNALGNGSAINVAVREAVPGVLVGTAGGDSGEVARVPVVQSVAVLRVSALISVALADVDKVRSLGGDEEVAVEVINEAGVVSSEAVNLNVGGRLSLLPGIEGGRATATEAGGGGDGTSSDLEGSTIGNVVLVVRLPIEVLSSIERISVSDVEVDDTINALSGASGPLRPGGEDAVGLNAFKLVGALNARSDGVRAHADLIEGGLHEGEAENVREGRSEGELVLPDSRSGEVHILNVEGVLGLVRELGVPTTVVGGGNGAAVTGLDGNVAENVGSIVHVPEVAAVVRA